MAFIARRKFLGCFAACALSYRANSQVRNSTDPSFLSQVGRYVKEASSVFGLADGSIHVGDDPTQSVASLVPNCENGHFDLFFSTETLSALENDFDQYAVRFVIYHEVSHALQMTVDRQFLESRCGGAVSSVRRYELLADCGAGFVFAKLFREIDYSGAAMVIADLSDYKFSDVVHHGFVSERASAFGLGGAIEKSGRRFEMKRLIENAAQFERSLFLEPGFLNRSQSEVERAQAKLLEELLG